MSDGPIRVAVRPTGPLRDMLGGRRSLELPTGATVADALAELRRGASLPEDALARAVVSVGGAIVGSEHALADGDEVALVLPVAGG